MITIRVYPAIKRLLSNTLDMRIEIEFDKASKYFWLIAWRLSRKAVGHYFIYAIQNILAGIRITELPVKAITDNLVNHPDLEEKLGLDSDHVIIDKSVYNQLRLE